MILRAIAAITLAALASCAQLSPNIITANVAPAFELVVEEHDAAVEADALLAVEAKALALAEGDALRALLDSAPALTQPALAAAAAPVLDRYDEYLLAGWAALTPFEVRYLTRTSDTARKLAGLPLTEWPTPLLSPSPAQ